MTPAYALAHVFIPNFMKLKSPVTVLAALERREKAYLDQLWTQAQIKYDPEITTVLRDPYRIGVLSLPPPKEMGEAHYIGIVVKKADPGYWRYFTLEHDYVLAKKTNRTVLCERDGKLHKKHGEGPVLTGVHATDATAFIDAFMEMIVPTRVTRR